MKRRTTQENRTFMRVGTLLLTLLIFGCSEPKKPVGDDGPLRLAISQEVAGCTVVGGERYGFATDLVDTISRRHNRPLKVATSQTTEELIEGLAEGRIDVAVVPRSDRVRFHRYPSEICYTTNYVLLQPSWSRLSAGANATEAWRGKHILADCNFRLTESYAAMVKEGITFNQDHIEGTEMAQMVLRGEADAIICERSEAELLRFLHRNLVEVASIEQPCEVIFILANKQLKVAFGEVVSDFSKTDEYAYMVDVYFGQTSIEERFTQLCYRPTRVLGGISVWDTLLIRISEQNGVDWRLMSAMAYHESRFRNDRISNRGAVGLMQVTPIVAEDLSIEEGYDLADPTTNATLAAKILCRYSRALGFGNFPTNDDHTAIVVASYNCGITRTLEAQRLAVESGGDKGSWADVSQVMSNMNDSEWVAENGCRLRRFRDAAITIAYTNGVMKLYNTYRNAID